MSKFISITIVKRVFRSIKKIGVKGTFVKIIYKFKNKNINLKRENDYKCWIKENDPTAEQLEKQRTTIFNLEPKISIIVPMYNTPEKFLEELVDSIINQTYSNWELCFADGSEEQNKKTQQILKKDERIKYKFLDENKGIAENTNKGIQMATGDYIALLDHDDLLPANSLYEIVKTINENPNVEFIYTDEDKVSDIDGKRFDPHFKPDFSIDFLRSNNYICHFSVFKKSLMDKLEGERGKYDGAQDFDLVLRMAEIVEQNNIIHIPKVLYHWRAHPNSTAQADADSKPYAYIAGAKAITDHLERAGLTATVEDGEGIGTYRVNYSVRGNPKVSIIISDGGKKCLKSILKKTTYKNYEIITVDDYSNIEKSINNCSGEYVVLLKSTVKIITKNWLENMLGFAQREDVGAVGVRIYNFQNKIQHAGIILSENKVGFELFKGLKRYVHGYFARESSIQDFNAVSTNCIMFKKSMLQGLNFSNYKSSILNDIDFCLQIRTMDKLVVYNPFVEIRDYNKTAENLFLDEEVQGFITKWKDYYNKPDIYYNPNFSTVSCNYDIKH